MDFSGLNYDGPSIGQAALGSDPAPSFASNPGGTNFSDWANTALGALNGLSSVATGALNSYANYKRTANDPQATATAANPGLAIQTGKPGMGTVLLLGLGVVVAAIFAVELSK